MTSEMKNFSSIEEVYENQAYDEFEQNINDFLDIVNVI